jgi:hypothetical protein
VVDFDERLIAALAQHGAYRLFLIELAWSALHSFIVSALCGREIGRKSNHFLDVLIPVIPKSRPPIWTGENEKGTRSSGFHRLDFGSLQRLDFLQSRKQGV